MSATLSQILLDLNDKVRNSTSGTLSNDIRARAVNRVLEELQTFADWKFTRRTKSFYFIDGITEYNLKDYVGCSCLDNDGATIILDFKNPYDLKPVNVSDRSLFFHESKDVRENIRRGKYTGEYSIDQDELIIGYYRQISSQLHNCDSLTANGVISAGGDAINLTVDDVVKREGDGSINFDTNAGTSLEITFTGISRKDLETLQNISSLTLDLDLPTISNFSSIELRWGSDSANYWSKTETAPAAGKELKVGNNKFAFRWAEATESGSPDVNAVDYIKITITFSVAVTDTDFRIDNIRVAREIEMELEYYSKAMVLNSSGQYQLEFKTNILTDILLGNIKRCVLEGAVFETFQRTGGKSDKDINDAFSRYENLRKEALKAYGFKIRRESKRLNFPSRGTKGSILD